MGIKKNAFFGILFSVLIYFIYFGYLNEDDVYIPKTGYFGAGDEHPDDPKIYSFRVNLSENVLNDLKSRLKNARIGHRQLEDVEDFSYGINLATLKTFQNYWMEKFDWKKSEAILNSFNQFTTEIEGLKIHFIHVKPKVGTKKQVIPLLLVHGWPGNVFEFYKIIPLLMAESKDSDFVFEVVAPSIPGYGWSEQPKKTGLSQLATARIFNKLMIERLEFKRYLAQGGDWGSAIVTNIAHLYPDNLYGIHINMNSKIFDSNFRITLHTIFGSLAPRLVFGKDFSNFNFLNGIFWPALKESGYFHIQATKPDTIGVGLNDSPIGLLAYILEKFSYWTNKDYILLKDGGLERKFTKDELLTIITIYWANQNILSSQRFYREWFNDPINMYLSKQFLSVPVGFAAFPNEIASVPRQLLEYSLNITYYTKMTSGGHFAAFEEPEALAEDIFDFAQTLLNY